MPPLGGGKYFWLFAILIVPIQKLSIRFWIRFNAVSVGIIMQPRQPIWESIKVFAIVILPGKVKCNLPQKSVMLTIFLAIISKQFPVSSKLFEISTPSWVNLSTNLKPRSRISWLGGAVAPTKVIVVFSTLQRRPENIANSSKIFFRQLSELKSALVATVVSSAKALALSVFQLLSLFKCSA